MKRLFVLAVIGVSLAPALALAQATDTIIYGASKDRQIFSINLTQGQIAQVGTLLFGTQAIEQDPETGYVYYFERSLSGDEFAYWNPATATNVRVRRYSPRPGFFAKRMAFAADGTLYLMDAADVLWTIDKLTGDLTMKGAVSGLVTGSRGGTGDIAFGSDGTLYLNTYRNLYTVDVATLTATPLYVNVLAQGQIGMGLAFCDGALYASIADEIAALVTVAMIDVTNGVVSPIMQGTWVLNDLSSCPAGDPPSPPVAPSLAWATAFADGRIELQWQDNSDNETGFRIERTTGGGSFQQIATVAANITTYVDTGLLPLTTYTYRVRSFNAAGSSDYSSDASATTAGNQAPTAYMSEPVENSVYAIGGILSFSGDATDPEDGPLPDSAFVWEAARVGGSFGLLASGVRSGSTTATTAGEYVIRLTVRDSGGLIDQRQVHITVQ